MALGATAASAADMPLKAPPLAPVFSWTGGYIGGNIGWIQGNADYDTVCPTLNTTTCPLLIPFFAFNNGGILTFAPNPYSTLPGGSASSNSFLAGGQVGYNYQSGRVVFGAEADLDATHIRTSLTRNATAVVGAPPGFYGNVAATSAFDSDWIGSVRGRLGLAWDRFMLYGTGGLAIADSSSSTAFVYTPPANAIPALSQGTVPTGASSSHTLTGWTVGAGGEWFVRERLSVAAEYRHSDFGHENVALGPDLNVPPLAVTTNVHYTTDQVTLRANWHFDWR